MYGVFINYAKNKTFKENPNFSLAESA